MTTNILLAIMLGIAIAGLVRSIRIEKISPEEQSRKGNGFPST